MTVDLEKIEVTHNAAEHRFETFIDGYLSKLDYIQDGKNFVITHVGVSPELRGQGIAGGLCKWGLNMQRKGRCEWYPCVHMPQLISAGILSMQN